MLKWFCKKWTAFWNKGTYPDDPRQRDRIKAFILGSGTSPKVRDGVVKVEVSHGE
jgi:hypothetical protein